MRKQMGQEPTEEQVDAVTAELRALGNKLLALSLFQPMPPSFLEDRSPRGKP